VLESIQKICEIEERALSHPFSFAWRFRTSWSTYQADYTLCVHKIVFGSFTSGY